MIIPAILEPTAAKVLEKINLIKPVADTVHIDIADGIFVDSVTATLQELYDAQAHEAGIALEFHLMVVNPLEHMELCQKLKARRVFWHYEAARDSKAMVKELRRFAFKKGIAVNPETELAAIENDCGCFDAVQVMGVHPGRQGEAFLPATLERVRQLRLRFPRLPILVDGGVNAGNLRTIVAAGADEAAVGSAIFSAEDPTQRYAELRTLVNGSIGG